MSAVSRKLLPGNEEYHSTISIQSFIEIIGYLSYKEEPPDGYLLTSVNSINNCLTFCFHRISRDDEYYSSHISLCQICSVVQGLLRHFANCTLRKFSCPICLQLYWLHRGHVDICRQRGVRRKVSSSDICFVLLEKMELENFDVYSTQLWFCLKKAVCEIYAVTNSVTIPVLKLKRNDITNQTLFVAQDVTLEESENFNVKRQPDTFFDATNRLLHGNESSQKLNSNNLTNLPLKSENELGNREQRNEAIMFGLDDLDRARNAHVDIPFTDAKTNIIPDCKQGGVGARPKESLRRKPSWKSTDSNKLCELPETRQVDNFNSSLGNGVKSNQSNSGSKSCDLPTAELLAGLPSDINIRTGDYSQDPYDTQKTYGESGVMSLPMDVTFNRGCQQLSSLEMRPVGQPGIGEVVCGTREQLRLVAHYWSNLKQQLRGTATLPQQKREEGVIISRYKKQLRILRTRYQKHYQWERLSHLGNGAAGKCHLAMDLTTQFKFCVKRLIIHKYEEHELKVWCDLEHENIVRLFGALRQGEKIYILAEFFDGGNLSACINQQKSMNRRLSHVMALTYLRQLLQVLVYLQSKGIIHEDLKCDNILLRRGSTSVAVCDFGLSRYINQKKDFKGQSPAGTSTQWSPEKAASAGHGFPSEVWAVICILVHIMSGDPPWLKRYQWAAMLHFIIFQKSPPLEDVPDTIREDMMDLIRQGFTVQENERPTAQQLLDHPIFKQSIQEVPEKCFSILSNDRSSLLPSSNNEDLELIVQNLQQKVNIAEKRRNMDIQQTSVTNMNSEKQKTSGQKNYSRKEFDIKQANSSVAQCNQIGSLSIPASQISVDYKIRPEVIAASSQICQMQMQNLEAVNSSELPKLSILEKFLSPINAADLKLPCDNDQSRRQQLFSKSSFHISKNDNLESSARRHVIKSSQSYPNANSFQTNDELVQTGSLLKSSMSAPDRLGSSSLNSVKGNDTSSPLLNIQKTSLAECNETETFHSNIFPPSISTLQININSQSKRHFENNSHKAELKIANTRNSDQSSLEYEDAYTHIDSFLNDEISTNVLDFLTPALPVYNNIDENSNICPSNTKTLFLPNLPIFENASWNSLLMTANTMFESQDGTIPVNVKVSDDVASSREKISVSQHASGNQYSANHPGNDAGNNNRIENSLTVNKSPAMKHKTMLHINIKKPIVKPYLGSEGDDVTQSLLKSAPIPSADEQHSVKFVPETAQPSTTNLPPWSQKSTSTPQSSTATRSSELDEERDKLLQDLHNQSAADSSIFDQEGESSESLDVNLEISGVKELQNLLTKQLQQDLADINGIFNFWDENKALICSVRAAPTIVDWKELFESYPLLQKIQDKKIIHFIINYQENQVAVDYSMPIDKCKTELLVSPTAPDNLNCWCDHHLNV